MSYIKYTEITPADDLLTGLKKSEELGITGTDFSMLVLSLLKSRTHTRRILGGSKKVNTDSLSL